MVTISNEDGRLVIVHKPTVLTRRGAFFSIVLTLLIVIIIITIFVFRQMPNRDTQTFLFISAFVASITLFASVILWICDTLRKRQDGATVDYDCGDERLTFDADKFTVEFRGRVSVFSYRHDARPLLRQLPHIPYSSRCDVVIPCTPLEDHVPSSFRYGFYDMNYIDKPDAKRILAAIKEFLEMLPAQ